jgi:hypothetical protein
VEHPGKRRKTRRQGEKSREIRKTPRLCKARPEKMLNAPSVQNTPGKMRKKHAGSKHPADAKHAWTKCKTHRRCKTRPEKCVISMPAQNTPAGAKHARKKCKTPPENVCNTPAARNTPGKGAKHPGKMRNLLAPSIRCFNWVVPRRTTFSLLQPYGVSVKYRQMALSLLKTGCYSEIAPNPTE